MIQCEQQSLWPITIYQWCYVSVTCDLSVVVKRKKLNGTHHQMTSLRVWISNLVLNTHRDLFKKKKHFHIHFVFKQNNNKFCFWPRAALQKLYNFDYFCCYWNQRKNFIGLYNVGNTKVTTILSISLNCLFFQLKEPNMERTKTRWKYLRNDIHTHTHTLTICLPSVFTLIRCPVIEMLLTHFILHNCQMNKTRL